jgi:branched-chain amino acid transport system substrate-binding protein
MAQRKTVPWEPSMPNTITRRSLLAASGVAVLAAPPIINRSRASETAIRIGCLTDLNGPYADLVGAGSVGSIKLAIEDFHRIHPDIGVELVVSDFSLKPDVGLMITRGWIDKDAVDAIIDVPLSPLALGIVPILQEKNKVGLFTSPATNELTRGSCGPNHVHFAPGTYCLAASLVKAILQRGGDTWFFILPDYAMGKSMTADASRVVTEAGGKIVGSVAHPFPGTGDFSSYLLAAQNSGAKVICLCNAGTDASDTMKQAHEFGLTGKGLILAVPFLGDSTIHAIGLEVAQDIYWSTPFYWDRNAGTRSFSKRLSALAPDRKPNKECAAAYSGALHYLKSVAALGVDRKQDGRAVVARMKAAPIEDTLFAPSTIRADGQVLRDMLLLQVKHPAASHGTWDSSSILTTLPADGLYVPLSTGGCKLIQT